MPIHDKHGLTHLGVRGEGTARPLCKDWRSSWNWTLVPAEVTCPACRAAQAASAVGSGDGLDGSGTGPPRPAGR